MSDSVQKRERQSIKRRARNIARMSRIRTYVKKARQAIENGSEEAAVRFKDAMRELHRGVTKGVLKKRNAARKIARLHGALKRSGDKKKS